MVLFVYQGETRQGFEADPEWEALREAASAIKGM
jgi:hypothetical protein